MGKAVAVEGEVNAEPSSSVPKGAKTGSGAWSAGDISVKTYDLLTVGTKKVIHEAKCTFTYKGGVTEADPKVAFPTTTETVTLTAETLLLQHGLKSVVVDGDEEAGAEKNKLIVSAKGPLTTS